MDSSWHALFAPMPGLPGDWPIQVTGVFTGHKLADELNRDTRAMLQALPRTACLAVLHEAANGAASAYADRIARFAGVLGISLRRLPCLDVATVRDLVRDPAIDAILPLAPFGKGIDSHTITRAIGPAHDADGQHPVNMGALALGRPDLPPPTAQAALLCATAMAGDLRGRTVTVVGASPRVGRPLALLLLAAGATVSVAHEFTRDLPALTSRSEIVVSATGVPGLITARHIAPGAVLIDVGIVRTGDGLVGDVDTGSVAGRAAQRSHVPDGVGPVTTACLMRNVATLALAHCKEG